METKRNISDAPSRYFEVHTKKKTNTYEASQSLPFMHTISTLVHRAISLHDHLFTPNLGEEAFSCKAISRSPSTKTSSGCRSPLQDQKFHQRRDCGHQQAREYIHDPSSLCRSGGVSDCNQRGAPGLFQRGTFWEIFSGESNLTKAMIKSGFRIVRPVDIKNGNHHDLSRREALTSAWELLVRHSLEPVTT